MIDQFRALSECLRFWNNCFNWIMFWICNNIMINISLVYGKVLFHKYFVWIRQYIEEKMKDFQNGFYSWIGYLP